MTEEELKLIEACILEPVPGAETLLDEVRRLRALVRWAEWAGDTGDDRDELCPWCVALEGTHEDNCPAFSARGVLR